MRRVHRSGGEVQEERLGGRHLFGVGDHRRGLLHQVRCEVVALLGRRLGFGLRIVAHQFGVVLVGVAAEEPVISLETPPQRPPVIRPGGRHRLLGRQVPFPDAVGVVATALKDLRQESVLERDIAVGPGITGRSIGQAGQMVRVVVAPGEDARARRRAQRSGVHIRKEQPFGRQCIDIRCRDRASVTAKVAETHIVDHDEHDVGSALGSPQRCRPGGCRLLGGAADGPREGGARPIFRQCHGSFSYRDRVGFS